MSINLAKVQKVLKMLFSWVNSEAGFAISLVALMWAYQYRATHTEAPFAEFVATLLALSGGYWWNRRTRQKYDLKAGTVDLTTGSGADTDGVS